MGNVESLFLNIANKKSLSFFTMASFFGFLCSLVMKNKLYDTRLCCLVQKTESRSLFFQFFCVYISIQLGSRKSVVVLLFCSYIQAFVLFSINENSQHFHILFFNSGNIYSHQEEEQEDKRMQSLTYKSQQGKSKRILLLYCAAMLFPH